MLMLFFEGGKSILKVAVKMKRIIAVIAILLGGAAAYHVRRSGADGDASTGMQWDTNAEEDGLNGRSEEEIQAELNKKDKERKGVYCFHECVSVYILWLGQVFCQSREVAHPGKGPFPPHNRRRLNRRYFWYVLFSPQDAAPPLQIWSSCDSAPTNSFNHVFVCQRQQITIR